MGTNILYYNCQVIKLKRKKLELYLKENVIDVIALNETFLSKKHNFKIPGYDTIRNDCSTGQGGSVAFLVKNGLAVNKEYRNNDLNIITDITKPWQLNSNFLTNKTSLWQPFTAQMEILV